MNRIKLMPRINSFEDLDVNAPPEFWEARSLLEAALLSGDPESLELALLASDLALDAAEMPERDPGWSVNQWDSFDHLYTDAAERVGMKSGGAR